jgi:hypothetical protein
MRKFVVAVLLCGFVILGLGSYVSYASEVDALLQKLIDKGILTAPEAQEIRSETNDEIAKTEKQKQEDYKALAKDILPDWVKNTKLKGDFRLRYSYNHPKGVGNLTNDNQRARLRLRMGLESNINDKVTVAAGLATGLGSPNDTPLSATTGNGTGAYVGDLSRDYARSANQTLTGVFSKKPIQLDYAYAKYTPQPWVSLTGGIFMNPFWDPEGKFIWDDNIRPEGAAIAFNKSWNPQFTTFVNSGYLVLDQNSGDHDGPMLYAFQPGVTYAFNDAISLKGAVSYYNWANIKGRYLQGGSFDTANAYSYGNTRDKKGNLRYGYDTLAPQVELVIKHPLGALNLDSLGLSMLDFPYLSLFGEYMQNNRTPNNNTAYVAGFKFGSASIDKWGDWQFQYDFRRLERDAIPDILPDADFYNSVAGGTTGVGGHRLVFQWGLSKNNWLAFNFYRDQKLVYPKSPESTFYADWNLKF